MFLDEMKGTTGCQEKQCYSYVNYTYDGFSIDIINYDFSDTLYNNFYNMVECLVKYRKPIYYLKIAFQYILIAMVTYHAHLALRDSDKSMFENRVRESINFIENNHPGYRMYMIE